MLNNIMTAGGAPISGYTAKYTTADVQKFLQEKVDVLVENMRKRGYTINKAGDTRNYKGPNIRIALESYKTERSIFAPFALILPRDVLIQNRQGNKNAMVEIISPKKDGRSVNLLPPFANFLKLYGFHPEDVSATFKNEQWRRKNYISAEDGRRFMRYSNPTLMKVNDAQKIVVYIDPLKVFPEMIVTPEELQAGKTDEPVNVLYTESRGVGDVLYIVERYTPDEEKKPGRNRNKSVTAQMMRR